MIKISPTQNERILIKDNKYFQTSIDSTFVMPIVKKIQMAL